MPKYTKGQRKTRRKKYHKTSHSTMGYFFGRPVKGESRFWANVAKKETKQKYKRR